MDFFCNIKNCAALYIFVYEVALRSQQPVPNSPPCVYRAEDNIICLCSSAAPRLLLFSLLPLRTQFYKCDIQSAYVWLCIRHIFQHERSRIERTMQYGSSIYIYMIPRRKILMRSRKTIAAARARSPLS